MTGKVYVIRENFPADSGSSVSIVIAETADEALRFYKEKTHRDCLPSWIQAEEITERVTEVYRYDNPLYEG